MADTSQTQKKLAFLAKRIADETVRAAGKGLEAGLIFLTARVKEELSVPAPRTPIRGPSVNGKRGPIIGYRATTRAIPGAPPRKLSGRLRGSITSYMESPTRAIIGTNVKSASTANNAGGFPYGKYHELVQPEYIKSGKHQYIRPTIDKYMSNLLTIVGQRIKQEMR